MKLDRIIAVVAALLAPVLGVCVAHNWLSAHDAEALGGIVAALVGGYHVQNDTARAALHTESAPASTL